MGISTHFWTVTRTVHGHSIVKMPLPLWYLPPEQRLAMSAPPVNPAMTGRKWTFSGSNCFTFSGGSMTLTLSGNDNSDKINADTKRIFKFHNRRPAMAAGRLLTIWPRLNIALLLAGGAIRRPRRSL